MPFNIVCPASRGLSLSLARTLLQQTPHPLVATTRQNTTELKKTILSTLPDVDPSRVHCYQVDVTSEKTLEAAAAAIWAQFPEDYAQYIFSTPGVLHPERSAASLTAADVTHTLHTNLLGPLLTLKHFSPFLPTARTPAATPNEPPSVWVSISARVGSIGDNKLGGWYSYRASKAGVNQMVRTFDIELVRRSRGRAMAVAMHPGTVKTGLSKEFWGTAGQRYELQEPEVAAGRIVKVVQGLKETDRGLFFDHKGEKIEW